MSEKEKKFYFRVKGKVITKNADDGIERLYFLLKAFDIEDQKIELNLDPIET